VPGKLAIQPLAIGSHWIHGTMALNPMAMFIDTMMNQTKALVMPEVNLRRVMANAVLVHTIAVMVTVARLLRTRVNRTGS
jgi:hypothetical protein